MDAAFLCKRNDVGTFLKNCLIENPDILKTGVLPASWNELLNQYQINHIEELIQSNQNNIKIDNEIVQNYIKEEQDKLLNLIRDNQFQILIELNDNKETYYFGTTFRRPTKYFKLNKEKLPTLNDLQHIELSDLDRNSMDIYIMERVSERILDEFCTDINKKRKQISDDFINYGLRNQEIKHKILWNLQYEISLIKNNDNVHIKIEKIDVNDLSNYKHYYIKVYA